MSAKPIGARKSRFTPNKLGKSCEGGTAERMTNMSRFRKRAESGPKWTESGRKNGPAIVVNGRPATRQVFRRCEAFSFSRPVRPTLSTDASDSWHDSRRTQTWPRVGSDLPTDRPGVAPILIRSREIPNCALQSNHHRQQFDRVYLYFDYVGLG